MGKNVSMYNINRVNDLELDEIDRGIIRLLQKNADLTHNEIAEQLHRSQPAIGMRIKKLREKSILGIQYGIDFSRAKNLLLVKLEIVTKNALKIVRDARKVPTIINVFRLSGKNNVMVLMASSSLRQIDKIVDEVFRCDPEISQLKMDLITDFGNSFILPFDFEIDEKLWIEYKHTIQKTIAK